MPRLIASSGRVTIQRVSGMNISDKEQMAEVEIRQLRFEGNLLFIELRDDRLIGLPYQKIKWLAWLADARPDQRAGWQIEPHGYAVWWDELDDGVELHPA